MATTQEKWICDSAWIGGARKGLWCLWCRSWTRACWSVVAVEGEDTVDGGRQRSVVLPLLTWITSRCWLWWVCVWLWLAVCDAGLDAEAEGLLWRCRWSVSEVVNQLGSVGWCSGLLRGGGSAAMIGEAPLMVGAPLLIAIVDDEQWQFWFRRLFTGGEDEQCFLFFFSNQNSRMFLFFFLDQTGSRVKHKHVNCLFIRTIKTLALIPNLMRNNK
jgi:hypothetical protein